MSATILLVDDDEDTRVLLGELLRNRGYHVELAESAPAVSRARQGVGDRRRRHRRPDARHVRHRAVPGAPPAPSRPAPDRAHRRRRPRHRDRGDPRRRLRLHHQAGEGRRARDRGRPRARAPVAAARGQAPALGGAIATRRSTASSARARRSARRIELDPPRRRQRRDGADHRRVAAPARSSSRARFTTCRRAATQPFVAINCARDAGAAPRERAVRPRARRVHRREARRAPVCSCRPARGTIFLDEIGEMPLEMQVKLLRVLQERKVRPVGGDEEVPFEARVITATNRDLETEVEEKRFREDLFYRINVVAIPVPPLRARAGDVLAARAALPRARSRRAPASRCTGISRSRPRACSMDYDWPGNVRELENCMERAVALCRLDEITVDDLPAKIQEHQSSKLVITTESPGRADHARRDGAALRSPGARRGRRQQDPRRAHPRHRSPLAVSPARRPASCRPGSGIT